MEDGHHLLAGEVAQVVVIAKDAGIGDPTLDEELGHFEESLVSGVSGGRGSREWGVVQFVHQVHILR